MSNVATLGQPLAGRGLDPHGAAVGSELACVLCADSIYFLKTQ